MLRRLSLVSSFLSRHSNESSETKHRPKTRTPSSTAAVDELEGMWTSYILCPDAGDDSGGGATVDAAETRGYSCPELEVGHCAHVSVKTAAKVKEVVRETTPEVFDSCVQVDEVEINVSNDNRSGGNWLTVALRQRAELQELERSQQDSGHETCF